MTGVLEMTWTPEILETPETGVPETGNQAPSANCCGWNCFGMCPAMRPAASPVAWLAARLVQWSWCSAMIENSVNLGWTRVTDLCGVVFFHDPFSNKTPLRTPDAAHSPSQRCSTADISVFLGQPPTIHPNSHLLRIPPRCAVPMLPTTAPIAPAIAPMGKFPLQCAKCASHRSHISPRPPTPRYTNPANKPNTNPSKPCTPSMCKSPPTHKPGS